MQQPTLSEQSHAHRAGAASWRMRHGSWRRRARVIDSRSVVVLLALLLAGCGGATATRPSADASTDPARLLDSGRFAASVREPGVVTINVHVPYAGEIVGTDRFIPFDRIAARRKDLPPRSTRLAIYCRTGRMSANAADTLARLGYRDVVELRGGMQAWEASGRTLRISARPGADRRHRPAAGAQRLPGDGLRP